MQESSPGDGKSDILRRTGPNEPARLNPPDHSEAPQHEPLEAAYGTDEVSREPEGAADLTEVILPPAEAEAIGLRQTDEREPSEGHATGALADETQAHPEPPSSPRTPGGNRKAAARLAARGARQLPPEHPPTFSDEVGDLDDEIRWLRIQLALKLGLQNAQLTKMLQRFDA